MVLTPVSRMGPPPRSFAADAHDCIMVRSLSTYRIQVCGARIRARMASSPLIVIPIAPSMPSCSEPSRCGLATAEHAERLVRRPTLTAPARDDMGEARVGTKKRLSDRTKKLTKDKRCAGGPKLLDKKSPIQGTSSSNYEAESIDALIRVGLLHSSSPPALPTHSE